MQRSKTYLALGDSMSIDDYTGVRGGGAVNQFFKSLGDGWTLDDRTFDGCQMAGVPRDARGELITLTIGGNDLLCNKEKYLSEGLAEFSARHKSLLKTIRELNPNAVFIVGNIYSSQTPLNDMESYALEQANAVISANCQEVGSQLAPIHETFQGNEATFLCQEIEPTFEGAKAIAKLFSEALQSSRKS